MDELRIHIGEDGKLLISGPNTLVWTQLGSLDTKYSKLRDAMTAVVERFKKRSNVPVTGSTWRAAAATLREALDGKGPEPTPAASFEAERESFCDDAEKCPPGALTEQSLLDAWASLGRPPLYSTSMVGRRRRSRRRRMRRGRRDTKRGASSEPRSWRW